MPGRATGMLGTHMKQASPEFTLHTAAALSPSCRPNRSYAFLDHGRPRQDMIAPRVLLTVSRVHVDDVAAGAALARPPPGVHEVQRRTSRSASVCLRRALCCGSRGGRSAFLLEVPVCIAIPGSCLRLAAGLLPDAELSQSAVGIVQRVCIITCQCT